MSRAGIVINDLLTFNISGKGWKTRMKNGGSSKLNGAVKAWRLRAEDIMRLPPKSAGTREMRVNAGQLLALIAEFEKLHEVMPGQRMAIPACLPEKIIGTPVPTSHDRAENARQ